ncbi:MAG TPA: DinB family protein [Gemmatimonadales bacterium]|nr:DinB family protein [Gemmatimonadales bacterium]
MSQLAEFRRLFRYEAWANAESLTSAVHMSVPPVQVIKWLGHLAGTSAEWRARLTGTASRLAVWPGLSLRDCAVEFRREQTEWENYLSGLKESALADTIDYRNTKGELWSSTVSDVLTHVLLHGSYHRGQIASAVRAAGGSPAYTDFIHASRQRLIV